MNSGSFEEKIAAYEFADLIFSGEVKYSQENPTSEQRLWDIEDEKSINIAEEAIINLLNLEMPGIRVES